MKLLCVFLAASAAAAAASNSEPNYRKLRDSEPAETYSLDNIVLKRDAGAITLKTGKISFTPAVLDRVTTAVFIGEGEFALKAAHSTETSHVKRVLNEDVIQESCQQAVFCLTTTPIRKVRHSARPAAKAHMAS